MPGPDYSRTARELVDSGLDPSTPCAVVSNAGRGDEETRFLNLAQLSSARGIVAPALLIVGEVAREHRPRLQSEDQPPAIDGTSVTSSPSLNL
jgi:siroheme synthase